MDNETTIAEINPFHEGRDPVKCDSISNTCESEAVSVIKNPLKNMANTTIKESLSENLMRDSVGEESNKEALKNGGPYDSVDDENKENTSEPIEDTSLPKEKETQKEQKEDVADMCSVPIGSNDADVRKSSTDATTKSDSDLMKCELVAANSDATPGNNGIVINSILEIEGVKGFAVTPVGPSTSYKGMLTSEILECGGNNVPEEPPKARIKKQQTSKSKAGAATTAGFSGDRRKDHFNKRNDVKNQTSSTAGTCVSDASQSEIGSFTRKLQQFLSGSKNIFSSTPTVIPSESERSVGGDKEKVSQVNANESKSICENHEGNVTQDAKTNETSSSKAIDQAVQDHKESECSKDISTTENVDQQEPPADSTKCPANQVSSENTKPKYTFTSFRDMIRDFGSPRSSKTRTSNKQAHNDSEEQAKQFNSYSSRVGKSSNSSKNEQILNGKEKQLKEQSNEQGKNGRYSREYLLELCKISSANVAEPQVSEQVDVSVAEDIELGTRVSQKYSPIAILSREFKLKYRL